MPTFEELLQRMGRTRLRIDDVRTRFLEARPELANAPDFRSQLLEALQRLEAAAIVELPRSGWDRSGNPALPGTVRLTDLPACPSGPSPYAWLPQLGFAADTRHPGRLADLRAINEFLRLRRGTELVPVPTTERSLQIFGDEKRLDGLRRGGNVLFEGRITLADLGAYAVAPPLPYETPRHCPPGRPILVLENHHSYESFRRWNWDHGEFAAVAYGGGWAFRQSAGSIDEIMARTSAGRALYLGDLDPPGIEVLTTVNIERAALGLPPVAPHHEFYRWLLEHGTRRPLGKPPSRTQGQAALKAFEEELGERILELWRSGLRVPQESLGTEQLLGGLVNRCRPRRRLSG